SSASALSRLAASTLFPYTTLFRSRAGGPGDDHHLVVLDRGGDIGHPLRDRQLGGVGDPRPGGATGLELLGGVGAELGARLASPPPAVVPTAAVAIAGAVAVAGTVVLGPFGLAARARALALLGFAHVSQGWE